MSVNCRIRTAVLSFMLLLLVLCNFPDMARAEDSFTVKVSWKCLSRGSSASYSCRNSSEVISSYKGGVVYVFSNGTYCDNDSAANLNTFKLSLSGRKSGSFACKSRYFDGNVNYSGSADWSGEDLDVGIVGTWETTFAPGLKQQKQTMSFNYKAKIVIRGNSCFATKTYRYNASYQSVPGAGGTFEYTSAKCEVGK